MSIFLAFGANEIWTILSPMITDILTQITSSSRFHNAWKSKIWKFWKLTENSEIRLILFSSLVLSLRRLFIGQAFRREIWTLFTNAKFSWFWPISFNANINKNFPWKRQKQRTRRYFFFAFLENLLMDIPNHKRQKNSWKFVYILVKLCRSPFNFSQKICSEKVQFRRLLRQILKRHPFWRVKPVACAPKSSPQSTWAPDSMRDISSSSCFTAVECAQSRARSLDENQQPFMRTSL